MTAFLKNLGIMCGAVCVGVCMAAWPFLVARLIPNPAIGIAVALAPIIIGGAILLTRFDRKYK